ncbi:MAG: transcription termination/antitermination protein NusG [Actinomycetaceae bacterium]|nr:transcription termination/antitermination protein NusG [Arcanobacterium sp.]MDD7505137.1 transcription termination/antitermination protein NusG [Actinomycetaceae bacterium]MDY6143873.1 transcription termination/antitermination protein NusG [Arcanobacterium sp.]
MTEEKNELDASPLFSNAETTNAPVSAPDAGSEPAAGYDADAVESDVVASEDVEHDANENAAPQALEESTSAESETARVSQAVAELDLGEGVVSEEDVRKALKVLPGRWYALHTYAGYEKRVKQDLEIRIHSMNMEDYIFQVVVPMEDVIEVKKGQNKLVSRVRIPGYALVRMDLTNDSWRVVQETNGVTGFVGNGRNPVALSLDEIVQLLMPTVEQEAAKQAVAAGKPTQTKPQVVSIEYEVGETVTLITEPWVGMPATISEVDAANQRLTVLMTLVGQETPVDLSFSQVKKAD